MRGYACIGLDNPKNPLNVGSTLRAAGCYGVSMVAISGERPNKYISRMPTDTMRQYRHMPVLRCAELRDVLPYDCVPVAVEIVEGARSLFDYVHPERAFYVFGAEDATLGERVLGWCRDVVYIPTAACMNLAATVNVVLYDRAMKRSMV